MKTLFVLAAVCAALAFGSPLFAQSDAPPLPGISLSLDEIKAQMFHVSAGRRLKPKSWPGGNQVAVALSLSLIHI